jgi:3-oxoacyl-(acyl-carrier-protein) synthase
MRGTTAACSAKAPGALMLETEASAAERGVTPLGEILGGGYACEAEGLVAIRDDGDGVARAITAALEDAELRPSDVGMIVAHANGTQQSDISEAAAIRSVFGTGSNAPPVTGFKWAFGHLIAAAGIVDMTIALAALALDEVPALATLGDVDPACAGLAISSKPQKPRNKGGPDHLPRVCRHQRGSAAARIVAS